MSITNILLDFVSLKSYYLSRHYNTYPIALLESIIASLVYCFRFGLYLKLFGLMGVTWVFEIVSWVVGGPESYWYFTDFINALRGVFIFVLFCLKRKVILLIKSKFVKSDPKFPIHSRKSVSSSKLNSSITSQRTNSIQLSHIA